MGVSVTPKPKGPSTFDVVKRKNGEIVLREVTADGKKLNHLTIDPDQGFVLRGDNDGSILPLDADGNAFVGA